MIMAFSQGDTTPLAEGWGTVAHFCNMGSHIGKTGTETNQVGKTGTETNQDILSSRQS